MNRITRALVLAMLIAPASAYAQGDSSAKTVPAMNCPMMGQVTAMQKDMGGLTGDMDAMMKGMSDPAVKARMQMMREHITSMMVNMQTMGNGLMGGATPSQSKATPVPSAAPPAGAEERDSHHPDE